jgi:hypothetical protein
MNQLELSRFWHSRIEIQYQILKLILYSSNKVDDELFTELLFWFSEYQVSYGLIETWKLVRQVYSITLTSFYNMKSYLYYKDKYGKIIDNEVLLKNNLIDCIKTFQQFTLSTPVYVLIHIYLSGDDLNGNWNEYTIYNIHDKTKSKDINLRRNIIELRGNDIEMMNNNDMNENDMNEKDTQLIQKSMEWNHKLLELLNIYENTQIHEKQKYNTDDMNDEDIYNNENTDNMNDENVRYGEIFQKMYPSKLYSLYMSLALGDWRNVLFYAYHMNQIMWCVCIHLYLEYYCNDMYGYQEDMKIFKDIESEVELMVLDKEYMIERWSISFIHLTRYILGYYDIYQKDKVNEWKSKIEYLKNKSIMIKKSSIIEKNKMNTFLNCKMNNIENSCGEMYTIPDDIIYTRANTILNTENIEYLKSNLKEYITEERKNLNDILVDHGIKINSISNSNIHDEKYEQFIEIYNKRVDYIKKRENKQMNSDRLKDIHIPDWLLDYGDGEGRQIYNHVIFNT